MNFGKGYQGHSYHFEDPFCFSKLESSIHCLLETYNSELSRDIVYLCIGTDRATGDCFGPLVGTRLQALLPSANIYGTLASPTHAANLQDILDKIMISYPNPLLIAIDASLGSADRIGYINVNQGGLKPGTALKKVLPEVGDFHISGVVNVGGFLEHMVLQNTRLYTVYRMAEIVARSIYLAHIRLETSRCSLESTAAFKKLAGNEKPAGNFRPRYF
ncbi:MAG: spore protease YyaC [Syntrophomonadaceae bacterium]|jgi:putative sporulation protein YyaC